METSNIVYIFNIMIELNREGTILYVSAQRLASVDDLTPSGLTTASIFLLSGD